MMRKFFKNLLVVLFLQSKHWFHTPGCKAVDIFLGFRTFHIHIASVARVFGFILTAIRFSLELPVLTVRRLDSLVLIIFLQGVLDGDDKVFVLKDMARHISDHVFLVSG